MLNSSGDVTTGRHGSSFSLNGSFCDELKGLARKAEMEELWFGTYYICRAEKKAA